MLAELAYLNTSAVVYSHPVKYPSVYPSLPSVHAVSTFSEPEGSETWPTLMKLGVCILGVGEQNSYVVEF